MSIRRQQFLRGGRTVGNTIFRPPYATRQFDAFCQNCEACVSACPRGILAIDGNGRASMSFTESGCNFCGRCAEVCETGALSSELDWPFRAKISGRCLALNGVLCELCGDACDRRAVRMHPVAGGRRVPILDFDKCSGCGECLGLCPENAIRLTAIEEAVH